MRRIEQLSEKETLADHFVSGVLSAIAMVLTLAVGPIVVAGGGAGDALFVYSAVHIWGAALLVIAFSVGAVVGPRRMAQVWGHLWGTEHPAKEWLTIALWAGIVGIIIVSYWLSKHAL
jgi:hypothetical protein